MWFCIDAAFLVSSPVKLHPPVNFLPIYALDYSGKKEFQISHDNPGVISERVLEYRGCVAFQITPYLLVALMTISTLMAMSSEHYQDAQYLCQKKCSPRDALRQLLSVGAAF
jgi:hypothetical protein